MDKSKWTYKKLGEVATFINGYAFKPSDWKDVGLPIIRIQNLTSSDAPYNYYDGKEIDNKYLVDNGDLLVSWSATLGAFLWNKGKAVLNQHIFKTVFDKTDINKHFLKYAIISTLNVMASKAHGITMRHITKKEFDDIVIPFPPSLDQQHIVSELDQLSELISLKQQQLKEYDALAQSLFYEMFGDPIINDKGWQIKCWNDVLRIINGKDYKGVENQKGKYPICGSGGIMGYANAYLCPENTVIIGRKGNINKPIFMTQKFWNIDTAFGLVADNINIAPLYLYYFCIKYNFEKHNKAVTIPSLTKKDLLKISIPLPPLSLQHSFASKVRAIEAQKSLVKQSIAEAQTLLDSRMQEYFG